MAYPKGAPRPEGSGRKAGTPNKKTEGLRALCEKHGINPFESMVMIAKEMQDPTAKFEMCEKICQYIEPKRKAIEHNVVNQRLIDEAQNISSLNEKELLEVIEQEIKELKKE